MHISNMKLSPFVLELLYSRLKDDPDGRLRGVANIAYAQARDPKEHPDVVELRGRVTRQADTISDLEATADGRLTAIARLQQTNNAKAVRERQLEVHVSNLSATNGNLNQRVSELAETNVALNVLVMEGKAEVSMLVSALKAMTLDRDAWQGKVRFFPNKLLQAERERDALHRDVIDLRNRLASQASIIADYQKTDTAAVKRSRDNAVSMAGNLAHELAEIHSALPPHLRTQSTLAGVTKLVVDYGALQEASGDLLESIRQSNQVLHAAWLKVPPAMQNQGHTLAAVIEKLKHGHEAFGAACDRKVAGLRKLWTDEVKHLDGVIGQKNATIRNLHAEHKARNERVEKELVEYRSAFRDMKRACGPYMRAHDRLINLTTDPAPF